jgi:hypothetical protein
MAQTMFRSPAEPRKSSAPQAECLFAALDGRDVTVKGEAWHVQVYGICEEAGRRWIQLAVDGPHHHMLTLVLATRHDVGQALRSVSDWLEEPSSVPQVVNFA